LFKVNRSQTQNYVLLDRGGSIQNRVSRLFTRTANCWKTQWQVRHYCRAWLLLSCNARTVECSIMRSTRAPGRHCSATPRALARFTPDSCAAPVRPCWPRPRGTRRLAGRRLRPGLAVAPNVSGTRTQVTPTLFWAEPVRVHSAPPSAAHSKPKT